MTTATAKPKAATVKKPAASTPASGPTLAEAAATDQAVPGFRERQP